METVVESIWTKSKVLIKGLVIAVMALLLMIPAAFISDLVQEREQRQKEAVAEVSSKWAGRQNLAGPILVLPYLDKSDSTSRVKHHAYLLPDELNVIATVSPEEKHRGIYKVILYNSKLHLTGKFQNSGIDKLQLPHSDILWNEAFLQLSVGDIKGLNEELNMNWNNQRVTFAPDDRVPDGSLAAPVPLTSYEELNNISFNSDIQLSGSEQLLFTPAGKSTTVQLTSAWPHPSFNGSMLPQNSEVKDSGFSATWKSLAHKRNFPQQWKDNPAFLNTVHSSEEPVSIQKINAQSFGVDLFIPVNNYQKTLRSVKYAAICILLTFATFFLIETTHKRTVHPFQYGLIGLAIILFYTLLLSFSEYIGFNLSYVIASVSTIGLIAWFAKGILGSGRLTAILATVLMLMYTYLFTILQLQDYSLLLGSIGLFITLGIVMHFSKKLQW